MIQLNNRIPDQAHQLLGARGGRDDVMFDLFIPIEDNHYQETRVNFPPIPADNISQDGAEDDDDKGKRKVGSALLTVTVTAITAPTCGSTTVSTSTGTCLTGAQVAGLCQYATEASSQGKILTLRLIADRLESPHPASNATIKRRNVLRKVTGSISLADFLRDTLHDEDTKLTSKQRTLLALDVASSVL